MPAKIANIFPPFSEIIGSIILAAIGTGFVSLYNLNASDADLSARLKRLEHDFSECRRLIEANDERWHDCRIRYENHDSKLEMILSGE